MDQQLSAELEHYGKIPTNAAPGEFEAWILYEDQDLLVVDKPGWLVCHPSKRGPLSSLVGAARLHVGMESLHLVARLDRETSGVVVLAKNSEAARKYQLAVQNRQVRKTYLAVLEGELGGAVKVDQPVGQCGTGAVYSKMQVVPTGSAKCEAVSTFTPREFRNGYTICHVETETGRRHQIRVHAAWLGHPIAGDKIYGPDETLFLDFMEHGWNDRMAAVLPIHRHALHCHRYEFLFPGCCQSFTAPVPDDIRDLCGV